jgi:hypothetical protein
MPAISLHDGSTFTLLSCPVGDQVTAVEPLRHGQGNAATGGIWRLRGPAGAAVLKIATPPGPVAANAAWPTSDNPEHWNYWRREVLAYETGLAAAAYPAIATAPVLAVNSRADGRVELWLADVGGPGGFGWPVPRLARFAYELGAGQARWAGRVPDTPWLSRRWLAQYLAGGPIRHVRIEDTDWDHPSVASAWPAPVRDGLRRLWAQRDRVLAAAEAAERTWCHLDVWPPNLVDDAGTSVLLDWSFTGEGALGEDVANLIIDSFADGLMDPALLPELAHDTTERYLDGLRDGGWSGSADAVRFAIASCGAAKYSWLAPSRAGQAARDQLRPGHYARDTSAASLVERLTGLVAHIAGWAASVLGDTGS